MRRKKTVWSKSTNNHKINVYPMLGLDFRNFIGSKRDCTSYFSISDILIKLPKYMFWIGHWN